MRQSSNLALLIVRHGVQLQVRKEIFGDLRNSVSTFQNFQRQRETTLTRSAELLADQVRPRLRPTLQPRLHSPLTCPRW